jgi:hypothetical protein
VLSLTSLLPYYPDIPTWQEALRDYIAERGLR